VTHPLAWLFLIFCALGLVREVILLPAPAPRGVRVVLALQGLALALVLAVLVQPLLR
jgi:hypothetical protein